MLMNNELMKMDSSVDLSDRRVVIGVSGAPLSLIESLSDHYSLSMETTIFDRMLTRHNTGQWDVETLFSLFKDVVDEIEVSLTVNYNRVILNFTPVDAISLMLLHLAKFNLTDKMQAKADYIINHALGLCPRFTHFIQIFPSAKENTINTSLLANLKAGIYNRYYERLGCPVIHVADVISSDKDRLDFIKLMLFLG